MRRVTGLVTWGVVLLVVAGCARLRHEAAGPAPRLSRPAGSRAYEFLSAQESPAGTHRVRVRLTLLTRADGTEEAVITSYENARGAAAFQTGPLSADCAAQMGAPAGAVVTLRITPPPAAVDSLIPGCVPEDLFGAATDLLPLLMVQAQPVYRVRELHRPGDRLTFPGYVTEFRHLPDMLAARISAESGVVRLDTLTASRAVIDWDTSPMAVTILRRLAPGNRALLVGREWFAAHVVVDPRSGMLLEARTRVDSLALRMVMPYEADTLPSPRGAPAGGMPVSVRRALTLTLLPQ